MTTLSFKYEDGKQMVMPTGGIIRLHEAKVAEVKGKVYAYGSFEMGDANPVSCVNGQAQGLQIVTLGEAAAGRFSPVVRFGLAADGRAIAGQTHLTPWLFDGQLDYYGMHARPSTSCDFKIRLDLDEKSMCVWTSVRGDDDWFMLAEDVSLINAVSTINAVRVEQYAGARGIHELVIQSTPWSPGEAVRPNPSAKKERVVVPGASFKFQSMRSLWGKPGRHVSVVRTPPGGTWHPDVVQTGPNTLVCSHNTGVAHAGGDDLLIHHSSDLGKTWSEPTLVHKGGVNCPRMQKLKDGTLLLLADVRVTGVRCPTVFYDSTDGGKTWTNKRFLEPEKAGAPSGEPDWVSSHSTDSVPSRVTELSDGSWLIVASFPGGKEFQSTEGEMIEFYRSSDKGETWTLVSQINAYPPHSLCEPSIIALPDDRLLVFAREGREDGLPGIKAYSKDNGETWGPVEELPFPITGRTCAGFLKDGRVMVTFRSQIGKAALWAWVGDPDDKTGPRPMGVHFNDKHTVALKDGGLHIDNDGVCGQFTQYFLRPPDGPESTIDVTVEVKVVANSGRAATLSVPFTGKFRFFPDRVELAHDPSLSIKVSPGEFHTYHIVARGGRMKLHVDGKLELDTDRVDKRSLWFSPTIFTGKIPQIFLPPNNCSDQPDQMGVCRFYFGNEIVGEKMSMCDPPTSVFGWDITPSVTGYSIWRRVEALLDDPKTGKHVLSWSAEHDGFPDQYQLDNIIEIEASISGNDQGYSGWIELEDERILIVNYTDDTAPSCPPTGRACDFECGVPWIRGTYVLPSDLLQSRD